MSKRTALLLGATGLIGSHCLDLLLADDAYQTVTTLGRRPLDREHAKLTHHVIDLAELNVHRALCSAQDVFCCLGTTMKQAGSKAAFRKVDFEYPYEAARLASEHGSEQYLLISSLGANTRSLFFYSRVKGEVEKAIADLPFRGVYIMRPSLLTGHRTVARAGEKVSEKILKAFSFALKGPFRVYRPIAGRTVAKAMIAVAKQQAGGMTIFDSAQIQAIADRTA